MTDDYKRARDAAAEAYRNEIFHNNPNGFTCAPYVNSDHPAESFESGADWATLHSPVILALVEKLNSIIAKSHSWVITRETGAIEKPIHEAYRALAQSALADYNKLRENL